MDNNKEYIINIRVSKETYNKLKNKAKENGETLSNLVRKTLDDSREILSDLKDELFGVSSKKANGVDYFQRVILAKDADCFSCGCALTKGTQVYMGQAKNGAQKYFCDSCFGKN